MENLEALAKIHVYHPVECLVNIYITSTQECYCNYDNRIERLTEAFKKIQIEALEEAMKMCEMEGEDYSYDAICLLLKKLKKDK